MLGHAIVLIAIHVASEVIYTSSALQIRDLDSFVENLQQNEETYNYGRNDRAQKVNKNKEYADISSRELEELINDILSATVVYNYDTKKHNDITRNRKGLTDYEVGNRQNRNLWQFDSYNSQRGKRKPNKSVLLNVEENSIDPGLPLNDDETKLYLVLNPRAKLNENDFDGITGLLTQILLNSAGKKIRSQQDNTRMKKESRYKGFVIADGKLARRRNHESKELYSQQNSSEDYKPKRVRSDYGGAGGRTPIPYIRHRDIYERE